jgi:peptidoglycan/LPS O-acetylase OafA/YrhL
LGYWVNASYFEWYVPALFAFYFAFPLLAKGIKHSPYLAMGIGIGLTALLVYLKIQFHLHAMLFPFIARIPIFMLGILFGKYTHEKTPPRWLNPTFLYSIALICLVVLLLAKDYYTGLLWYYGLYWFPFLGITPGLCLLVVYTLEKTNSPYLLRTLSFLGALSLEIYLLHIKPFIKAGDIATSLGLPRPLVLCIIIALVIPLSYFLAKGINALVSYAASKLKY